MDPAKHVRVGLLYYVAGSTHVQSILLDDSGAVQYEARIKAEMIFPNTDGLLAALEGDLPLHRTRRAFEFFACDWGRQLIPPPPFLDEFDVLVVIPHHTLHGCPLHAVVYGDTPLGCVLGVTYNPSVTLLEQCMARNKSRRGRLDSIQADRNELRCLSLAADVTGRQKDLYAEVARSFAEHFKTQRMLSDAAGRAAIKNLTGGNEQLDIRESYDVLCLVSHGYLDRSDPQNSGILLNSPMSLLHGQSMRSVYLDGEAYVFRDLPFTHVPPTFASPRTIDRAELLTIRELKSQYATTLELVAIFGCSTASGALLSCDDFISLSYHWLNSGATSVLASQWTLDADVLKEWSRVFVNTWVKRCQPKALAWREANIHLSRIADPYDWSVLALFGDWY